MPPQPPIRVFLVEDHAITFWGLQRLIETAPRAMVVIGSADSRAELIRHPQLPSAEVLILDLDLGGEDGLQTLPEVQRLSTAQVLVLTSSDDVERQCHAVALGARGLLHKSEPPQKILEAIQGLHSGAVHLSPHLVGQALRRLTHPPRSTASLAESASTRIASLTVREREIVGLVSQRPGDRLLGLAVTLQMSEHTLRNHLTSIYAKLGVRGRLELHVFATTNRLAGD